MIARVVKDAMAILTDRLGLDPHQLDFQARKLESAGLLDRGEPSHFILARLLVAAMVSSRPIEAVEGVKAYEDADYGGLIHSFKKPDAPDAPTITEFISATAATIPGSHIDRVNRYFAGNVVEVLSRFIADAPTMGEGDFPTEIHLARDFASPRGFLWKRHDNGSVGFFFGCAWSEGEANRIMREAEAHLQVRAIVPGSILRDLATITDASINGRQKAATGETVYHA